MTHMDDAPYEQPDHRGRSLLRTDGLLDRALIKARDTAQREADPSLLPDRPEMQAEIDFWHQMHGIPSEWFSAEELPLVQELFSNTLRESLVAVLTVAYAAQDLYGVNAHELLTRVRDLRPPPREGGDLG